MGSVRVLWWTSTQDVKLLRIIGKEKGLDLLGERSSEFAAHDDDAANAYIVVLEAWFLIRSLV